MRSPDEERLKGRNAQEGEIQLRRREERARKGDLYDKQIGETSAEYIVSMLEWTFLDERRWT